MGWLDWLKGLFGRAEVVELAVDPETFVFLVVRDDKGPMDRAVDLEDPLDERLQERGLGEVSGGGSQLGDLRDDGTRGIEWCGIDIDLVGPEALGPTLELLRDQLVELGVPQGSEIHYTEGGVMLLDRLGDAGWDARQPRAARHPGFGV